MSIRSSARRVRVSGSRRSLYRRSKRVLLDLIDRAPGAPRARRERAVRELLRDRPRRYLARLVADHAFALSVAGVLLASAAARAIPPIDLADVAAGDGGFIVTTPSCCFYISSAAGAGDVNGDGLYDIVVGEWSAVVVFGKADGDPVAVADVIAGDGGGFFIDGGDDPYGNGVSAGFSLDRARDVDGDGFDDVILGSPERCFGTLGDCWGSGQSFVVFGKDDFTPVDLDDVTNGIGGFEIHGDDSNGRDVSDAADVNGDGLPDVVIGAPYVCHYQYYNGKCAGYTAGESRSYVVFGKADGAAVDLNDLAANQDGFVINPPSPFDHSYAGCSVSGGADFNGDDLGDVVIGARGARPNGNVDAGAAYVVFGKADGTPVDLSEIGQAAAGFAINGCAAGDAAGQAVSVAGDVNGDDIDDVIVVDKNLAYVVFGKASMEPVSLCDVAAGVGGFPISVHADIDDVAVAGDMNRDGLSDIIIGVDGGAGTTYVIFGKADGEFVDGTDLIGKDGGDGGFAILGYDDSGTSVSGTKDVNGDGLRDLVIAGRFVDPQGAAYVVFNPLVTGDVDQDGAVGTADLLMLLAAWGPCPPPCVPYCPADFDQNCTVGTSDLLILLANWD